MENTNNDTRGEPGAESNFSYDNSTPQPEKINLDEARAFLKRLDPEADNFTFQTFDDKKQKRRHLAEINHLDPDNIGERLSILNRAGAGVFVTINKTNGKGRTAEHITRVRAVFVDLDGSPLWPVLDAGLEPHIVVQSSPGRWHAYWLVDDCSLEQFKNIQRALAARFNSDMAVNDLPRVMRLPGFIHQKAAPFMTHIVPGTGFEGPPYPLAEIIAKLGLETNSGKSEKNSDNYESDDELKRLIREGEKGRQHEALRNLAARYVSRGAPDDPVAALRQLLEACTWRERDPATCKARWNEIPELVSSAKVKFSNHAPAGDPDAWPEPQPLPKPPPVPEFPLAILPDAMQAWAADAADRARYRPDFFAVAAMVALGSVVGRKIGIRMKSQDDWTEYANIWGCIVGDPSALKSPAQRDGMISLKGLQVVADEEHAKAMQLFKVKEEAHKLRSDVKRKKAVNNLAKDASAEIDMGEDVAPETPPRRTYWTSDVNDASLSEILVVNPNGLLIERDELSSLLSNLEDEKQASLRGMLLSGWSAKEGFRSDRIMRGITYIPKYSLSVFGGIQPGPLMRYVRGAFSGERADGLLQRFQLITWPDPQLFEYIDRWPNKVAKEEAKALFQRADTFDPEAIGSHDAYGNDTPYLRFAPDAQEVFADWYTRFMQSSRGANAESFSAPLASHFGKYPGLVGKLSLSIHIADDGQGKQISLRTLTKALAWLQYLTPHAMRVYHAAQSPETGAAELLLSRLKRKALPPAFKAWEISRNCWHGLTDREAVKKACRLLHEYGWLIEIEAGGSGGVGRPADPVYTVSPAVGG